MFNRPSHQFSAADATEDRLWDVDSKPGRRLGWLFVLVILPLLAVIGRLVYLQGMRQLELKLPNAHVITKFEPIACKDGRILSSDGKLLAYDVDRYHVQVHYRWLEQPADKRWLRDQIFSRLTRKERRNKTKVATTRKQILAERQAIWRHLSQITSTPEATLASRQSEIQKRVERILASVEKRHQKKKDDQEEQQQPVETSWLQQCWDAVVTTLTTPPKRMQKEPIVIREEVDYHTVIPFANLEIAKQIESHSESFPGVRLQKTTERIYPQKSVAAHLIGYRLPIDDDVVTSRKKQFPQGDPLGIQKGDRTGRTGIERSYDRALHGLPGSLRLVKDRRGTILRSEIERKPRRGRDLILTIHLPLQQQAEQLLDKALEERKRQARKQEAANDGTDVAGASIVVMNVQTGAILAAVSAPRFDLSQMSHPTVEQWKALTSNKQRPFIDRSTQMALPPGSIFKTVSAATLLESGKIDPDEPFYCQGYLSNPKQHRCYIYRHYQVGHENILLRDAISQSCNVYFFHAAKQLGPKPFVTWASRFGFGQPTGIDLPFEKSGNLPDPTGKRLIGFSPEPTSKEMAAEQRKLPPWYMGQTLGLAIGQDKLTATPLQIVRMMAAIANGGFLVTPHVVQGTGPTIVDDTIGSGIAISPYKEPRRIKQLSKDTILRIQEALARTVSHPRGTGYKTVRLEEIAIAGKTGTAEVGAEKKDHAWFAGYVPAKRPKVAFVIVLEHAGSGGKIAGPVAKQLVKQMLRLKIVKP